MPSLSAPQGNFVGIDNYVKMISRLEFPAHAVTTAWFAIVSVAAEMVIGVLAALLLNQQFYGRGVLRALMILPWALPTVVNATLWRLIYNPEYGALNAALTQIGVLGAYRSWLGEPGTALAALILADCWKNFPLVALIALAALQAVPRDITAASLVDGAGPFARFRFVILPYLAGPLMVALVLRTIEAFKVFDIIWVMTRGGPANSTRTLSILVYQEAFSFQRAGSGASLALIVTLLVTVLAAAYAALVRKTAGSVRMMERREPCFPSSSTSAPFLLAAVILAPILWLFIMSISPAADLAAKPLRLVAAVHGFLALRGIALDVENSAGGAFTSSLVNSIEVAGMATIAAIALAIPAGWAVSRTPSVGWSLYDGDRHLHAAAGGAGGAALYGTVASRHAEQRLRARAGLSDHPGALHHLADEIRLRFHPEGDRGGGDDRRRRPVSRRCGSSRCRWRTRHGDIGAVCLPACLG
jgi:multiple sugar transport system permease protein